MLARFRGEMGNLLLLDSRWAAAARRVVSEQTAVDAARDSLETASWAPFLKIDLFYQPGKSHRSVPDF